MPILNETVENAVRGAQAVRLWAEAVQVNGASVVDDLHIYEARAEVMYHLAEAFNHLCNTDNFDPATGLFTNNLSSKAFAQLLLEATPAEGDDEDKRLATEVAITLGPDLAQAWYHFIVLVTKIA